MLGAHRDRARFEKGFESWRLKVIRRGNSVSFGDAKLFGCRWIIIVAGMCGVMQCQGG